MSLADHLASLPAPLAQAVELEYRNLLDHFLKYEWDDAQVDAGRFSEAVLRILEWHVEDGFTPIDGKSKPDRKHVVNAAAQDMKLPPTLRLQVPSCLELMMDFRNGRNAAHLGDIDANRIDATCVVALASWVMAELVRLETRRSTSEVQAVIDQLARRHVPLVQHIGERPIVLDPELTAADRALVLLYQVANPVAIERLQDWAEYRNQSRWRAEVLRGLERKKYIHIDAGGEIHLLRPGETAAQQLLANAGQRVA